MINDDIIEYNVFTRYRTCTGVKYLCSRTKSVLITMSQSFVTGRSFVQKGLIKELCELSAILLYSSMHSSHAENRERRETGSEEDKGDEGGERGEL